MMRIETGGICAIFVTFYPDRELLARAIEALKPQTGAVVVVDNTPEADAQVVKKIEGNGVFCIPLGQNLGIAAGHNVGIGWARDNGFTHVLLMDQDSVAAKDMVGNLSKALSDLCTRGIPVAAVGPNIKDDRDGELVAFIDMSGLLVRRRYCADDEVFEVGHLISSGCLIPLSVIDKVGGMEEDLFIDYVDIEWSLRAKAHGFGSYAVGSALLSHRLGDKVVHITCVGHRRLQIYSPIRYFYQFRNAILLYKRSYIPFKWVIYNFFIHLLAKFVLYSLVVPPRLRNTMMMIYGAWCGIVGCVGPCGKK